MILYNTARKKKHFTLRNQDKRSVNKLSTNNTKIGRHNDTLVTNAGCPYDLVETLPDLAADVA